MKSMITTLIVCISILSLAILGIYLYKINSRPSDPPGIEESWEDWDDGEEIAIPEIEVEEDEEPISTTPQTYREALDLSSSTGKRLFLYFYTDNCPACTRFESTLQDPQISQILENYVVYRINTRGEEGYVGQQLRVSRVPYYIIASPDRDVIKRGFGNRGVLAMRSWLN